MPAAALDLRRRITWLMLLRTVVISLVLGLALWMSWAKNVPPSAPASLLLLVGVVGGTYALTIVGAAMVWSRRTTALVTGIAMGLLALVALVMWKRVLPVPLLPSLEPWTQSGSEFLRTLGVDAAALAAVGGLSYLLAGELQRT